MKLIYITFEGTLKPKQRREFAPLEIKFLERRNATSDDEKYIKGYQARLLKTEEEVLIRSNEEQKKGLKKRIAKKVNIE